MTINERYEAAKAALAMAKDGEDADAIKSAIDEFKAAEAAKKSAEEADDLIKSLGTVKENTPMEDTPKNLGEFAAKNLDLAPVRDGAAKSAGTNYGFKAYTDPQVSQTVYSYSTDVADQGLRDLAVRQLFGQEQISVGNALNYFVLGAKEDNSAPSPKTVAQAAAKPQFHIVEGTVTATLQKIAGWFYETDELLEDNAYLASALNNRGLYELDAAVEAYLLTTLQSVSGIGTDTYAHNGDVDPDTILDAIMSIKNDTRFNADAIIINPTDYAKLRELKTASGSNEYVGGGCFYGPHGNGPAAVQPGIWGLNTVVTKDGAGARIEIVTGDHDDAIYNRVTVVVEERIALATRYPKAFVKITEAAS